MKAIVVNTVGRDLLRGAVIGAALSGLLAASAGMAHAATIMPLSGQTADQMGAHQQQCAAQASSQSCYNPSAAPVPVAAPSRPAGQRAAGAVRGAAVGQVTSNVTKNSTEAVEGGAKLGAMAGGAGQRRANRDSRQQAQQQQATEQHKAAAYNSSPAAYLQARGYSVQ
jgi:hypothetical protein